MTTGAAEDEKKEEPPKPKFDMVQMSTNDKSQKITVGGDDNLLVVGEKVSVRRRLSYGSLSGVIDQWRNEIWNLAMCATCVGAVFVALLLTSFLPLWSRLWVSDL